MLDVLANLNKFHSFFCENLKVFINLANTLHYIHLAQKLCFWTGIIFIGVYVSVCV